LEYVPRNGLLASSTGEIIQIHAGNFEKTIVAKLSEFAVIAGFSGVGKTTTALNITKQLLENGNQVAHLRFTQHVMKPEHRTQELPDGGQVEVLDIPPSADLATILMPLVEILSPSAAKRFAGFVAHWLDEGSELIREGVE
jgi:hypothetical protein